MPKGSRHVPRARPMASRNSAALSSSQCTDSLVCGDGGDGACAPTTEAHRALMESSRVLCKGSSSMRGPAALTLLAGGDSRRGVRADGPGRPVRGYDERAQEVRGLEDAPEAHMAQHHDHPRERDRIG